MTTAPEPERAPIFRVAPPTGPGWVHATVTRRTYRRRLGWAEYDLALLAEDRIHILRHGWRFIGTRPSPPLCEVIADGWIPRPRGPLAEDASSSPAG